MSCSRAASAAPDPGRRPPGRSPGRAPAGCGRRRPCAGRARRWPSAARAVRAGRRRPARSSTSSSRPARGCAPSSSLVSSAWTRSAVIRLSSPAIASSRPVPRARPRHRSVATNRAARSIRSGSSANDSSGVPGCAARRGQVGQPAERVGERPVAGHRQRHRVHREVAPAQILGRAICRTPPRDCALIRSYRSARNVVISQRTAADLRADRAEVDAGRPGRPRPAVRRCAGPARDGRRWRSRGRRDGRPISASRTVPPTRCSSCPAAANAAPSSCASWGTGIRSAGDVTNGQP